MAVTITETFIILPTKLEILNKYFCNLVSFYSLLRPHATNQLVAATVGLMMEQATILVSYLIERSLEKNHCNSSWIVRV